LNIRVVKSKKKTNKNLLKPISDEINEQKIIENEKKKELFEKMRSQMEADLKVTNLFI
jgi:hypothetical protein